MAEIRAEVKVDYEEEGWTVGIRIDGLLVHDIEGVTHEEGDDLAERINKYDEAVRLLERVKLENDDNCIHSDLAVDIDAFLAPKEAEDEWLGRRRGETYP